MPFQLSFDLRHKYKSSDDGITVEANLQRGDLFVVADAKIDCGAEVCLFSREIGERLGIEIESGLPKILGTLTGDFLGYGHELTIKTLGFEFQSIVYFSEFENLPRNFLGRNGWLRLVRLAIIDYDEELYLSLYNDQI
ncbi:MAG: hypothetical protein JMDDDDMK_02628 [Acidobacteria bacterium]|nr:hypothetical protein [Acidobacteriota bacterium]